MLIIERDETIDNLKRRISKPDTNSIWTNTQLDDAPQEIPVRSPQKAQLVNAWTIYKIEPSKSKQSPKYLPP